VCIRYQLQADESIVLLKEDLFFRQFEKAVGTILDVAVGCDDETAGARRRVLYDFAGLWLHEADDAVDQRAWRKILPRARFLLCGVLFEQAFIEITEPLLPGGKPVELVDCICKSLEVGRLAQLGLCIDEDGGNGRLALCAQVEQEALVKVELLQAGALFQLAPAVIVRKDLFPAGLGHHFEEKKERQLGNVLVIRHAIDAKDVAETPKFGDNVARRRNFSHYPARLQISSLMSARRLLSLLSNTLFSRV
jgi:hypothetical protein